MKIRHKITLWIAGSGVFVSFVFSIIVFLEMIEQPYRMIDEELKTVAQVAMRMAHPAGKKAQIMDSITELANSRTYWIKIYNDRSDVVYQSELTRYADLPLYDKHSGYTVRTIIPKERVRLNQDKKNEVTFRVRRIRVPSEGDAYIVQIGKPIEKLDEEIYEIIKGIGFGLLTAMLLLIILSYLVAGRVLKPIGVIERLAREINDKKLSLRIPLGKNRDELYRLSESLNRMFDRLQNSFEIQKQFLANASHELKSPLALLQLSLDNCIQHRNLPVSLEHQLVLQTGILRRMSHLVKNLLDLSALELKEQLDLKEINLVELLQTVLGEYELVFNEKKVELQADMPPELRIKGDRDNLQRAVVNLVDNAVKYNREGGEIRIKLLQDKRGVHLSLFNTGAGIPKADLGRVFDQFYRVEKSRSTKYGGSGLGLSIVKRIIELHGGRIEMESEPSAWTRVNVDLP